MPHNLDSAPMDKPLNARQRRFVAEYLVDGVAAAAARRAGYGGLGRAQGWTLMKSPRVRAAIAEARAARAAPMTREMAIEGLRRIAEANVLDYARTGPDGTVELDLARLDRERAGAVKGLTVTEKTDPRTGVVTRRVAFTLADRAAALARLAPLLTSDLAERAGDKGYAEGVQSVLDLEVDEFVRLKAFNAERSRTAGYGRVRSGRELGQRLHEFWLRERRVAGAQTWEMASDADHDAWDAEISAAEGRW
ncbi:MAG: terminase small subunit [Caulobacter sp.]|nr:terminase small subunit [Caulobacter sp.]